MRIFLLLLFCLVKIQLIAEPLKVNTSAKSAILMNAETGAILYEKKSKERSYPSSLTKIATCLYAVKNNKNSLDTLVFCSQDCVHKMNKNVKIAHGYKDPAYFLEPDGTHYWMKKGEKISFKDLLYGMMLASGNDAANTIANYIGGNIPKFVDGMNIYLKKIGCEDTHFTNPHGLHHPNHSTTAYDIAVITREALKDKLIRSIISTKEYERSETNLQGSKKIANRDLLIQPGKFFYPRAVGMKTGHTSDAGYPYAGVARDGDRILIAVLMGYENPHERFRDAIRIFETAFEEEKETRLLFNKDENTFSREIKQGRVPLQATLAEDISISYYPAEEPQITIELNWEHIAPPIRQGDCVGKINILDAQNRVLESASLVASGDVERCLAAFMGAAIQEGWSHPQKLQRILILFLSFGILLTFYGIFRKKGKPKR